MNKLQQEAGDRKLHIPTPEKVCEHYFANGKCIKCDKPEQVVEEVK